MVASRYNSDDLHDVRLLFSAQCALYFVKNMLKLRQKSVILSYDIHLAPYLSERIIPPPHQISHTRHFWVQTGPSRPTADDEVWVEDAQGGLVGTLLIVNCGRDDEAERDASDSLKHDEDDDQHQGSFIRHLPSQKREKGLEKRLNVEIKQGRELSFTSATR